MVISHMFGGLGNQLFQYAAGRRIASRYNVPLLVDLTEFEHYKLRKFELEYFNTNFQPARESEISALRPSHLVLKAAQYLRPKRLRTYHRERRFVYDPTFEKIGPSVYLKGYFQCLPYFDPISDLVRKEFTIRREFVQHLDEWASILQQPNCVGLHVRRGDYKNADVQALLAEAGISYYESAIATVNQRLNPVYYVFSDDVSWVKENLRIPDAQYISGVVTRSAIEDFYLLSCCAHQIIPNSTFAWWAAWLNSNPAKTVIMPAKWFNDESQNRDRTPAEWITL